MLHCHATWQAATAARYTRGASPGVMREGQGSFRAKVEHVFRVLKQQLGFSKTRLRGLQGTSKNASPSKSPRGEGKTPLLRLTVKACHRKTASRAITPTLVIFCNSLMNEPAALLYLLLAVQHHRCRQQVSSPASGIHKIHRRC